MAWSYRSQDRKDEVYAQEGGPTTLGDQGGGGSGVVDGQQLFDNSHVLSLDAGVRALYGNDGITETMRWSSGDIQFFYATSNNLFITVSDNDSRIGATLASLDYVSSYNGDGGGSGLFNRKLNIDLLNRKLYASDGTTEQMDWSNSSNGLVFPYAQARGTQGRLADETGWVTVNWRDQILFSTDHSTSSPMSIDFGNRKLYNPDGTTVAIDYGTNGQVTIGDSLAGGIIPYIAVDSNGTDYSEAEFAVGASTALSAQSTFIAKNQAGVTSVNFNNFDRVIIDHLPTSDPTVANQLWNDAGTLKVSTG